VLHLVPGRGWPEGLDPCADGDTVVFLSGSAAETPVGATRCLGSDLTEDGLLELVFEHDVVLTW
jgi:hypothetical protein